MNTTVIKIRMILQTFVVLFLIGTATLSGQTSTDGKVAFSIKKGLSTVKGEFQKFNYIIDLNGQVGGTAEVASVKTKSANRDKHLQSESWFNAEKYPHIEVKSQKITQKSHKEYVGIFDIKIKGTTQTKEIPFQIINENGRKILNMNFNLSLNEFNIGSGFLGFIVSDKVTVNLSLPF